MLNPTCAIFATEGWHAALGRRIMQGTPQDTQDRLDAASSVAPTCCPRQRHLVPQDGRQRPRPHQLHQPRLAHQPQLHPGPPCCGRQLPHGAHQLRQVGAVWRVAHHNHHLARSRPRFGCPTRLGVRQVPNLREHLGIQPGLLQRSYGSCGLAQELVLAQLLVGAGCCCMGTLLGWATSNILQHGTCGQRNMPGLRCAHLYHMCALFFCAPLECLLSCCAPCLAAWHAGVHHYGDRLL